MKDRTTFHGIISLDEIVYCSMHFHQKYITARSIIHPFRNSSSLPTLVEASDGKQYVVKWKCTGEGPLAPAVDWIALRLAEHIGLLVPQSCCIRVEEQLAATTNDGELRDLVKQSLGANLAVEYLPDAQPLKVRSAETLPQPRRDRIFFFDVLLLNIDRTDFNPNILISHGKAYCIDFSNAMEITMTLSGIVISEEVLLSRIRRHPFYSQDVTIPTFQGSLQTVREIVDSVPDEWLKQTGSRDLERIVQTLHNVFEESEAIIRRRLNALKSVHLETPEELRAKAARNRKIFEEKIRPPNWNN